MPVLAAIDGTGVAEKLTVYWIVMTLVFSGHRPNILAHMKHRRFLFLQGVCSPFFPRLSDALRADGHKVYRINFNAGDALYWGRRPAWSFRGSLKSLEPYLQQKFDANHFTDIVLFGDQRPIHLPAIAIAKRLGVRVHVFEEGYTRPHWITLERGGVNGHSMLPRDPAWYLKMAARLPQYGDGMPMNANFKVRAVYDMAYHLANLVNPLAYPGYRTHRPHVSVVEYAGWARRFALLPLHKRQDAEVIHRLMRRKPRYYLLPLQLNGDTQISYHSSFGGMCEVIEDVVESFACHAPAEKCLLIKNHPLDTGLIDYRGMIKRLVKKLDLGNRVEFIETGHLPTLFDHAHGVVTVNSTAGLSALLHRCPTLALGNPIYDLPGLTHQGRLDEFWCTPNPPNDALFKAFRNTVIHTTQINGDFFSSRGISHAVMGGSKRMLESCTPLDALLSVTPVA